MTTHDMLNENDLDGFIERLPWDEYALQIMFYFNNSLKNSKLFLKTVQSEAKMGFKIISPYIKEGNSIFEIGSGLGLLSGYLNSKGINITALEPGLGGFGFSFALAIEIRH